MEPRSRSRSLLALSFVADAAARTKSRLLFESGGRQADGSWPPRIRSIETQSDLSPVARAARRRSAVHVDIAGVIEVGDQQADSRREGKQRLGTLPMVPGRARLVDSDRPAHA